jgi:hypothetical protein
VRLVEEGDEPRAFGLDARLVRTGRFLLLRPAPRDGGEEDEKKRERAHRSVYTFPPRAVPEMEPTGFEPVTSCLPGKRSPS